jgi:hypothetical protein
MMVSAHKRWNLFFNRRVEPRLKLSGVQVLVSATASQQRNSKRRLSETEQRSQQTIALWSGIGFSAWGRGAVTLHPHTFGRYQRTTLSLL